MDDHDAIKRCKAGDREAFRHLVARYQGEAIAHARAILGDGEAPPVPAIAVKLLVVAAARAARRGAVALGGRVPDRSARYRARL